MRKILLGSVIAGAALLAPLTIGTASAAAPAAVPQSLSAVSAYAAWA
ncbi:MAG: hypothetical protein IRZ07_07510, partial [Microbispora sp.]|nr:hypothetical protein [Microbispora sp.]